MAVDPGVTYRAAELMAMKPPLYNGGHCFIALRPVAHEGQLFDTGVWSDTKTWWCLGCHQACPTWAIKEGYVTTLLGRWCPRLLRAIGPA